MCICLGKKVWLLVDLDLKCLYILPNEPHLPFNAIEPKQ